MLVSTASTAWCPKPCARRDHRADRTAQGARGADQRHGSRQRVGGGINIVTKRATEIPFSRLTPFFMSAGNYGLHLETSRRFGDNKEWGVRSTRRDGEASIDDGNWRTGLAALSLDYRGERLRWTARCDFAERRHPEFPSADDHSRYRPLIPAPPDARSNWYPDTISSSGTTQSPQAVKYNLPNGSRPMRASAIATATSAQNLADSRTGASPAVRTQFGNFNVLQCLL